MSHISTNTDCEYNDEESIQEAAAACGLAIKQGQKEFATYLGQKDHCDFAMIDPNNPDAYECGFKRNEDGTFDFMYDSYSNGKGMMDKIGAKGGEFAAEYKLARTKKALRKRGVRFREERKQVDGRWKKRLVATMRGR